MQMQMLSTVVLHLTILEKLPTSTEETSAVSRVIRDKVCGCSFCRAISPDDDVGLRAAATTVSPRSRSCVRTLDRVKHAWLHPLPSMIVLSGCTDNRPV